MKILAVDSSSKTAAAALLEDGTLVAESLARTDTHSAVLLPMIEDLLKAAKTALGDVGLMAVTVGPGSFTGVRIGVSLVKGLAFADRIPCVGVSTLEAMAYNFAGVRGLVVPVLDARRETVFTAVFHTGEDGSVTRLTEDAQLPVAELMTRLADYPDEPVFFAGDAADAVLARPDCPGNAAFTPLRLRTQSAFGAGIRAYEIYTAPDAVPDDFTDAALVPSYLKKSQAERERDERIAAAAKNNG
jgi:tRNA threonylcarbamoyladenosine biosynthesis protein TsaB